MILLRKGLVPTPAIPVAATAIAAITPITLMIMVAPAALMIPVSPTVTVVAVVPTKTTKFEDFGDPHIASSLPSS